MHIGYWGENPEGGRPLIRPRCRSVNNIKMDRKEWVDSIDLAEVRDR
jgi:hypothetical protein